LPESAAGVAVRNRFGVFGDFPSQNWPLDSSDEVNVLFSPINDRVLGAECGVAQQIATLRILARNPSWLEERALSFA